MLISLKLLDMSRIASYYWIHSPDNENHKGAPSPKP